MNDERTALENNDTFVLTELLEGVKPVGARWVFGKKQISGYKAGLVTKGFSQTYGLDYNESQLQSLLLNKLFSDPTAQPCLNQNEL